MEKTEMTLSKLPPLPMTDVTAPLETEDRAQATEKGETLVLAGQWTLIWWKFRKHKLAMFSLITLIFVYIVALFAEFFAPFPSDTFSTKHTFAPPQTVSFFVETEEGRSFLPHVNGYKSEVDPEALKRVFKADPEVIIPVGFFVRGYSYKVLGLFETNVHLFGPKNPEDPMYLFGADRLGRDVFSRTIHGTRVSMSIGLVGVIASLVLGVTLGGISGYYGGTVDNVIQRVIEFLRSIPTIPLWMGLAAAVPLDWPPLLTYFAVTLIISLIAWTSLAREVRGKFLALRTEDFVTAARLDGLNERQIIFKHLVPSFTSHIIASLTLAIPAMILAETALSFLGIGLQPPIVSWGVLLKEAQNIRSLSSAPWLLLVPGTAVVTAVLALNFLGDGLRDAADPYA